MDPAQSFPPGSNPAPTSRKKKWWLYVIIISIAVAAVAYLFRVQIQRLYYPDSAESTNPELDLPPFEHAATVGDIDGFTASSLAGTDRDDMVEFTYEDSFEREGDTFISEQTMFGLVGSFTQVTSGDSVVPWTKDILSRIDPESTITILALEYDLYEEVIIYRVILSKPLR